MTIHILRAACSWLSIWHARAYRQAMEREKFHGRVKGAMQSCAAPGCVQTGEFRAPNPYGARPGFDGPGEYQFFCLDHVREFNARYNYFAGMNRDEIEAQQAPIAGWANAARVFNATGVDAPPKWADFTDPIDAISSRFRAKAAAQASRFPPEECRALKVMGLADDADRKALRARYSQLVRAYHPDRNGGDRAHEKKLQAVVEAYQLLRRSSAFT